MSGYQENVHYVGNIIEQDFVTSKYGSPQIILTISLRAKAKRQYDVTLKEGVETLDESLHRNVRLYLDLSPSNPKLDRVIEELKALGFDHTDPKLFARLHPKHRQYHSFVGKDVLLRVWQPEGGKDRWYLVTSKVVEAFDYDEFVRLLDENMTAYESAAGMVG